MEFKGIYSQLKSKKILSPTRKRKKKTISYILPYSKLQFQNKLSSNSEKNSKCHISKF